MDKHLTLKEYIKDNILITDGATGTYFSEIAGVESVIPEIANRENPEMIEEIHSRYINAGAKLIRTNTFSVNSVTLETNDREKIADLIQSAYKIAKKATMNKGVFIAANIGPIPENGIQDIEKDIILEDYKFIVDVFLSMGADIFNFETFSSTEYLEEISEYIKRKRKDAFILSQFALTLNGHTRKEIAMSSIIDKVKEIKWIDAYGFNCGMGPVHLYNILKRASFKGDIVSVLPNSGYPEVINERTVFSHSPKYFADVMNNFRKLGIKIFGGCCGTTPEHIRQLYHMVNQHKESDGSSFLPAGKPNMPEKKGSTQHLQDNKFSEKLKANKFVIAVELDPPFGINLDKLINSAKLLKKNGVDIITIADSPLSRVRADSLMVASKIMRESDIEVMPHIACRDKNIIALKSGLLAAYIEGIRNILTVTGDPIPETEKNHVKSVFNMNSVQLIELIRQMNNEHFIEQPYNIGGALNLNAINPEAEILRMERKIGSGARYFLTQPIFDAEKVQ